MLLRATIRASALLAALSIAASAQTTPPPSALADPVSPQAASPAVVTYSQGQLSIAANNTSLNQILREISAQLHMKISGGVTDQPVFGDYGPASPTTVLNQLLDGTEVNILLVQSPAHLPVELILTPRNGGPTPPNLNSEADHQPQNNYAQPNRPPFNNQRPANSNPAFMQPRRTPPGTANPAGSSTEQPAQTVPQSPNGVPTPQQIYEQRMRLLRQRQQEQQQTSQ